jgi:acyl-CoA synthetase (NDP forming)
VLPSEIDVAVIVVPALRVIEAVDECGKKGVKGLVIISAGFGEAGPEGIARERILREKVLSYGMRLGPNCRILTILMWLNATFSPVTPPPGTSASVQSGARSRSVITQGDQPRHSFVSFGNRMDDLLEYWEDDVNTDVIVLYQSRWRRGSSEGSQGGSL